MIGLGVWLGWKEGGAGGVVSWGGGGENRWPVWAIAPPAISGAWPRVKISRVRVKIFPAWKHALLDQKRPSRSDQVTSE